MKKHLRLSMSWLLCVAMLFGLGAPVYAAADTTAPVVKDVYITNPKDSYTEGDIIYFNVLLEEDSDLDYAKLQFSIDGGNAFVFEYDDPYNPETKIASFEFLIDDSMSSGTWKFDELIVRDCFGNYKWYNYDDAEGSFLKDLSFEVVGNATDTMSPVIKDIYITNPKDSYTEGDQVYINILLEEDSDLDYASLHLKKNNVGKAVTKFAHSYNPETKIASFEFLIDDSMSSGTWKFDELIIRDYYGNFLLYYYFDSDAGFLKDFSFKVDNSNESTPPCTPDDFLTYDWTGCVDTKPTVSLTSSTNQLYTMVALPGSASSDVTMTHTGSSSIVIGSWGRFTEGYQLTFPAPGVYKLKFIQNVTNDSLYYYANITDHEVSTYTENEGLKIATCKTCDTTFEQVGTPSWRMENNKLVGTEYTTGLVMIGLYDENGSLINAKYCERGDEKIIGGTTFCSYTAPQFTKAELSQAEQILCFNFTEQYIPIRDRIEIF